MKEEAKAVGNSTEHGLRLLADRTFNVGALIDFATDKYDANGERQRRKGRTTEADFVERLRYDECIVIAMGEYLRRG